LPLTNLFPTQNPHFLPHNCGRWANIEHRNILKALEDRDADAAEKRIKMHILESKKCLMGIVEENGCLSKMKSKAKYLVLIHLNDCSRNLSACSEKEYTDLDSEIN